MHLLQTEENGTMKKIISAILAIILLCFVVIILVIYLRYGGGGELADLTTHPSRSISEVEVVGKLDMPPCNIAVSDRGRIFFTFHPEAHPDVNVAELVDGLAVPFPSAAFNSSREGIHFQSVQSVRIDRQGMLWALDHGNHGFGQPRLLAFDINTRRLMHQYDFPAEIAPLGSQLNDFQITPAEDYIYIADASIFRKSPAIIVYDVKNKRSRRVLENHASVTAEKNYILVNGIKTVVFGIFAIRPNIDSFSLDQEGEWLYYSPTTNRHMYRIQTKYLKDWNLDVSELPSKVEIFSKKTASDGTAIDRQGTIYITNPEQSSVDVINQRKVISTLFKDPSLAWPDGFSFGPNNWLYMTNSGLNKVVMKSRKTIIDNGPYTIVRFKVDAGGVPGQ